MSWKDTGRYRVIERTYTDSDESEKIKYLPQIERKFLFLRRWDFIPNNYYNILGVKIYAYYAFDTLSEAINKINEYKENPDRFEEDPVVFLMEEGHEDVS